MSAEMTETVAAALRAELVEHVSATSERKRSRRRRRYPLLAVGVAALVGGGVALATQVGDLLPGGDKITTLATPIVTKAEGTKQIDLGSPPPAANRIDLRFRCLSAGKFVFPDGANVVCTSASRSDVTYHLALAPGEHTIRMSVSPAQARWLLEASYVHSVETAWGVNANGQTYGIRNSRGTPDLLAVVATNGAVGYAYSKELTVPQPKNPAEAAHWHPVKRVVPVYQPDGTTVIGQYGIG